jgi:glycosyltransferase involved in cell wall biosynthesis
VTTVSVVTPSLDQGRFLSACIESVSSQGVDVEHVVMDGGSHDETRTVLKRYGDRLALWHSGPDAGIYAALNDGFARTSGDVMGWLNADDMYAPGALATVLDVFDAFPEVEWLTSSFAATANEQGHVFDVKRVISFDRRAFRRGFNLPRPGAYAQYFIPQESTFWRRSLWERTGGLDSGLRLAGDFDLWSRFYRSAELWCVRALLGIFRSHPAQKSRAYGEYLAEAELVLERDGGRRYSTVEAAIRSHVARQVTNQRIWRLPTRARQRLERAVVYRTRELMWVGGRWTPNTHYFV